MIGGFVLMMQEEELTNKIIGCAYTVHNELGSGFLEKVYENALSIELSRNGLTLKQQLPIEVYYDLFPICRTQES